MKKVIILSYYFPPGNMTASERIYSWAAYLHEHNIYPTIVTRNWDVTVKNSADLVRSAGDTIIHRQYDHYEVYYVPYKQSFKDNVFLNLYGSPFYFFYLILAFLSSLKEVFTTWGSPLMPLYRQAKQLLKQSQYESLVISGNPFGLFHFGYKLHREFGIPWIADYRDDWTTNEIHLSSNIFKRIIQKLTAQTEKKWVGSAGAFISVSDYYVEKIHSLLPSTKGYTLLNGFIADNYVDIPKIENPQFTISYAGSIYPQQPVEIFLRAAVRLLSENIQLKVNFIGIASDTQVVNRVKKEIVGYESHFEFTERVSKSKAIEIQFNSHLLLVVAHQGLKGTPGSKLYEYIALKKPVLLCPSDHEIIADTLADTGQAFIAENEEACYHLLKKLQGSFLENGAIPMKELREEAINKYSRHAQTSILAEAIHQLID